MSEKDIESSHQLIIENKTKTTEKNKEGKYVTKKIIFMSILF